MAINRPQTKRVPLEPSTYKKIDELAEQHTDLTKDVMRGMGYGRRLDVLLAALEKKIDEPENGKSSIY